MNFPTSILVSDLLKTHPDFNAGYMSRLKMYYGGGGAFDPKNELRPKPIESATGENAPIGAAVRTARLACCDYTNYFGDTVMSLVATLCRCSILIDRKSDAKTDDYWTRLTDNADGQYGSATSQVRSAATDDFNFNRGFYLVRFPKSKGASNLQTQLDSGELDARILPLCSEYVNDWMLDDEGGLEWARTYEVEQIRSLDYGPYDKEKHTWTYYTKDVIQSYVAEKRIDEKWEDLKDAKADVQAPEPHALKVCPVFMVQRRLKCWVGDKLLPTAHKLFNEEADASYYRMTTITGGLFIFADDPAKWKKLNLSPFGAPIGGVGDKIERDKCDAGALDALEKGCAATRGQLGGLIHQMAVQTASQSASGQNTSRASGSALKEHADPVKAFLVGFAEGHLGTWWRMLTAIANIRQEDISDLEVSGLISPSDDDSTLFTMDRMTAETAFAALPNVSDEAKQARGVALGLEANEGADESVLESIKSAKIKPPEPAPIVVGKPDTKTASVAA